jgi:phosphatidate phosphatase PAH1
LQDGVLSCTGFIVHIARDTKSSLRNETIDVFVNDQATSLRMVLGERHNGQFADGGVIPSHEQLQSLPLRAGTNRIAFQLSSAPNSHCEAFLFLWTPAEALVICDIDGPILRSDLLGYGAGKLGVRDSAHKGVCEVFSFIAASGYRVVYVCLLSPRDRVLVCQSGDLDLRYSQ